MTRRTLHGFLDDGGHRREIANDRCTGVGRSICQPRTITWVINAKMKFRT